jgi:hypothetical protein
MFVYSQLLVGAGAVDGVVDPAQTHGIEKE